jgi:hypothetical protein
MVRAARVKMGGMLRTPVSVAITTDQTVPMMTTNNIALRVGQTKARREESNRRAKPLFEPTFDVSREIVRHECLGMRDIREVPDTQDGIFRRFHAQLRESAGRLSSWAVALFERYQDLFLSARKKAW